MESAQTRHTGRSLPRGAARGLLVDRASAIAGIVTSSSYDLTATYNDLFDEVATQMRFFQELTDFCNAARVRRAGCKRARFGAVWLKENS
jgi:hypothetical protein